MISDKGRAVNAATSHTCTKHEPGSRACYIACSCRCRPCTDAATAWQRRFNHAKANGRRLTVPVEPIAAHVARLRTLGMTLREISRASGASSGTIRNIVEHRIGRVSATTAVRVLGVRQRAEAGHGHTDSAPTARRLQALAAIGYDGADLAPLLGWSPTYVRHLRMPTTRRVHAATHDRVDAVWHTLQATPRQGGQRVARLAERRQWAPPAAWDDGYGPHGIDNPAATPHPWQRGKRRLTRWEDVLELAELGVPIGEMSDRLGIKPASIEHALTRHGRDDLRARIIGESLHRQKRTAA